MKTAIFYNKATKEEFRVIGVRNIGAAWALAKEVCDTMNWNEEMFAIDVKVSLV